MNFRKQYLTPILTLTLAFILGVSAISLAGQIFNQHITLGGPTDPIEAWSEFGSIIWKYNSTLYMAQNMSTNLVSQRNINLTRLEVLTMGNMSAGGTIWCKEVQWNTTISLGNSVLVVESYLGSMRTYTNQGRWYLTQLASDPSTAGWGAAERGRWWYNTADNRIKYWDGTQIQILPGYASGSGGVSPYSYLVYKTGATYYMQAANSSIMYSSTNASKVLNFATGNSSQGDTVILKANTFNVDHTFTIPAGVYVEGMGINNTIVKATAALTGAVIKLNGGGGRFYGGISKLTIDGSLVVSGAGGQYGYYVYKGQRTQNSEFYIMNTWDSGIEVEGTGTGNDESVLNTFVNYYVINSGVGQDSVHAASTVVPAGVELSNYTPDNTFFMGWIGANYRAGYYFYSSGNRIIQSGHIWGSVSHPGTYGIYLMTTARDKIEGNEIEHMGRDGIRVYGGSYNSSNSGGNIITGNTINGNSYGTPATYDGIFLYADSIDCENNIITNNRVWDRASIGSKTQRYGINFHEVYNAGAGKGYIDNLVLTGNDFTGNNVSAAATLTTMNGSGNLIYGNVGLITEKWGKALNVDYGDTVTHGLTYTPSTVLLTANSTYVTIGVSTVGSTTFTLIIRLLNGTMLDPNHGWDAQHKAIIVYWEAKYQRVPWS